jgi:glycine/D-amino acid oxidase-like deaminating enzyme
MAEIVVLGAGIVGVATALYLQRDGHDVRLIDRDEPGRGCSFGNAGLIQCSSVVPLATPGVLAAVPRMLLDPDQPLVLRWRHLPSLMPYLTRFIREAHPHRVDANARALAAIIPRSYDAYRPLIDEGGLHHLLRRAGELYVYESDSAFHAARTGLDIRRKHGVEIEMLEGDEVRELEPALSAIVRHGVFLPNSYATSDPFRFVSALAARFVANGGKIVRAEVQDLRVQPDGSLQLQTAQGMLEAEKLVIATGAFSARWAHRLGSRVILNSERGYHMMLPHPAAPLKKVVLSGEYRFAMTPLETGVRLAGTAELSRIGAPPDYSRARRLFPLAKRLLPDLQNEESEMWMGHRPSTPDSLPVIDQSPVHRNVFYAFGHGHSGLSLGGVTGTMIADLVAGRTQRSPSNPLRIDRF